MPQAWSQAGQGFIYGTVITDSDEEYTGFIRWGKEEVFWHDIFNSVKTRNMKPTKPNVKDNGWNSIDWNISSIWKDSYAQSSHSFACFFGDISNMRIKRSERVDLTFKNGYTMEVKGGSNDIATTLRVHDYELGRIKLDWDDIDQINFFDAPLDAVPPYGKPLYGTLKTNKRQKFQGYIKWDLDERVGADILDGDNRNGSQKIPFEKIKILEKTDGNEALWVTFESGREIKIWGSNDCDDGNRGIAIYIDDVGSIEVDWDDFEILQFEDVANGGPAYREFEDGTNIEAEVITYDDGTFEGIIAFDKDELWNFELIDGNDDDFEYQIPVRNIERIVPKNRNYSMVYLRNGDELLLGDRQDVSNDNDGILLMTNTGKKSRLIPWDEVDEIIFKK